MVIAAMLACIALSAVAAQPELPFADSQFYSQGDYSIHYRVLPASGPRVGRIFMIHGFLSSTLCWESLAAILNQSGYDCVLADLPGFGYSTREGRDVDPIDREDLMAGLMQTLAPGEQWLVAGHSMGGGVALNIACMHPELVESLLLYAPARFEEAPVLSNFSMSVYGGLINVFTWIMIRIRPLVRMLLLIASSDPVFALRYDLSRITDSRREPDSGSSMLYMAQRARMVEDAAISQIAVPILLLWGEKDRFLSKDMVKGLQNALPQARTYWLDAGHLFIETDTAETARLTLDFLK